MSGVASIIIGAVRQLGVAGDHLKVWSPLIKRLSGGGSLRLFGAGGSMRRD